METTLDSLRISEAAGRSEPRVRNGRIARRVVGLFILSALVPLCLCALLLSRAFDVQLRRAQDQSLDGLIRGFGMAMLGRLGSADDVLEALMADPRATDASINEKVATLPWVRATRRIEPAAIEGGLEPAYPSPNARQTGALRAGKSILLWARDEHGGAAVYLVRTLPSRTWLYTALNPAWLWADADDYANGAALLVLDDHGSRLAQLGRAPPERVLVEATQVSDGWASRSWELFLASRFSSPSWRLVVLTERSTLLRTASGAYWYLLAFIGLTILLIAWSSMISIRRQMRPLELLTQATQRIAQRDFAAFRDMRWNDEFGDLARSFDAMSDKLKTQFEALETLAEVDRLLLGTPNLELILDALLPRIAPLIRCDSVSVLLFDADSTQR